MNRFITLSGQRMNVDHMVMIFRPAGKPMTVIATAVPDQPPIGVREMPDAVMEIITRAGLGKAFITLTGHNIGTGKIQVSHRHLAAYGKNMTSGSGLIFAVPGISPEPVRETPEQIDGLLNAANGTLVHTAATSP